MFLLILAYSTTAQDYDFDLWARLIAGMGVVDGHQVLKADFLSYPPVHTWYDHEWGSGVVFYFFLKHFGPYSLIFLQAVLVWLIFFFISKFISLRTDKPYNILFYLFAVFALLDNFNQPVRCHLFSFAFFAGYLYLVEYIRKSQKWKWLFIIPFLTILWNNLHGGVVSGIGLLGMYSVGTFLNDRKNKIWLKFLITAIVSFAVLIINPWGIDYIKFLLMANTMARVDIVEWWGLFSSFHLFKKIPFKIFLAFVLVVESFITIKQIKGFGIKEFYKSSDKVKWVVLLATLYLSIKHVKLIPFFVMSGLAFVYQDLQVVFKNVPAPKYLNKLIYSTLSFVLLFYFATREFSVPLRLDWLYPVREVEFVKINNLKGNLLANFGIGSYISYKLYPHNKIFMDGRYEEVYPDNYLQMLKKFHIVTNDWDEILVKFPPDVIIVEKAYNVSKVLTALDEWVEVFDGGRYLVFVKKQDLKKSYIIPTKNIDYYKNTLFDTDIKFEVNNNNE